MATHSDYELFTKAITEVAGSDQSMMKLARAAVTRPNCEGEWVYEIDGTNALAGLEKDDVAREVPFGQRRRADIRIRHTLIEFKSTKPWYAESGGLQIVNPPASPVKGSAQAWLGRDIDRMATAGGTVLKGGLVIAGGIFVLIVSTDGCLGRGEFKDLSVREGRELGIQRYEGWLRRYTGKFAPGATIAAISAGHGSYRDVRVTHDALVLHWPGGTAPQR